MKIIIEEIGDHIAISFTGKGKKSDRIKLLMMVMVETLVDGLVSDLTDAQLQDAASIFANEMKTVVISSGRAAVQRKTPRSAPGGCSGQRPRG